MKITLASTTNLGTVNGVRTRLWKGTSESGLPVWAWIALIGVPDGYPEDLYDAFERELLEQAPPTGCESPRH